MTEDADGRRAATRLASALRAAVLAIRWEYMWRALWAPVAVVTLFVGIALTDILPAMPDMLHAALLALIAILFGISVCGFSGAFRPISGEDAARRVEHVSGLKHRPLTALVDRPAAERLSPEAQTLWQAHIMRALQSTQRLALAAPKPGVAGLDQLGLRFMPVLVLFVGVLVGGTEPWPRVMRALSPSGGIADSRQVRMDLWITPPAYTGLAPSVFNGIGVQATGDEPVAPPRSLIVPVGSQILVHATDAPHQPALMLDQQAIPLQRLGDADSTTYKLETAIDATAAGREKLRLMVGGSELAAWPVRIAPDALPAIEFERAPSKRRDTQLEFAYIASDDYGIKRIDMAIRRPNGQPVPGGPDEIRAELPLSGDRRDIRAIAAYDVAAHPWAGLPVKVRLYAEDTAGQIVESDSVEVVLPERIFNHPVARALAEARKALNDPEPAVIATVAENIRELSFYPMRFFDDTVAFLAIRIAFARLTFGDGVAAVPSVQRLLWETALRIEDGEFALAEADMMRMQEIARQALRDGKLGEELNKVMRELQDAMDRYMQALSERLQEMGLDHLPQMPNQAHVQTQDIQEIMDRIKELAESGNRQAAEQMLAELQRMLEQVRQGMKMQDTNPAMAEARKAMDQLRSLTEDQQKLLDKTFRESRRGENDSGMQRPQPGQSDQQRQPGQQGSQGDNAQSGQDGGEAGRPTAAEQDALRRRLGELMMQMDEAFGKIPENLGRADQQMEQAGKNMGKGEMRDATGNQTQALQELRDATNKMAEAMAQQFGAQMGLSTGSRPAGGGQQQFDPFGRRNSNENGQGTSVEDSDVNLPNRMEIRRAREILDELRRRSGDRSRPQIELDYIDRLLDIF